MQAHNRKLLKKDVFGATYLISGQPPGDNPCIRRDAGEARFPFRWIARHLLAREARALTALEQVDGVPKLLRAERLRLDRPYVDGEAMQVAKPNTREYYLRAASLLRQIHRHGVVHNDLAKEPNLLLQDNGRPAIIDFQLSWVPRKRNRLFRILGREDIRHLLKHKRTYRPADLTEREKRILNTPSFLSRVFMTTIKPIYLFVTRKLLGWRDREGAGDRQ